jgi:magnesium transporter
MTAEQDTATLASRFQELLQSDDVGTAVALLTGIHPADQAHLYLRLDPDARHVLVALLSAEGQAQLLTHLDEEARQEVVDGMPRPALALVLDRSENDVAADILRLLPQAEAARVLSSMATATNIAPLLEHADESAGGLMTRGYVALHRQMTTAEAITFLRLRQPLAEEAYYLYVLDGRNRLQGVVNLRQLIVSDPRTSIEEVMARDVIAVQPDTDQEEAARLLQRYRLRALPVVDEESVLRGIITADDVIDVLAEEATEDMYRMVGLPAGESVYASLSESTKRRLPWLFINLFAAFAAAGMVAVFQDTIAKAAALAVFMPVVAGQGGNAGIQTITIVVRGIAVGEIELRDARRVLAKEVMIGVVKGITFGLVVGLIAWSWQGNAAWGLVVGLALLLNMLVAGALGALIPLGLRSLRLDPAIASGIFLMTFTDVLGFLFLLGLATLLINQLT